MKKFILLSLAILYFSSTFADIGVKSFRKLEHDLDALVHNKLMDNNNELCAIIKVVTTETGFYFDGGTMGIYKTVNKPAEIWVYVSRGIQRITITHAQLGKLIYSFPMPIEKATVYEMTLATGRVITTVEENTIESQFLVITPEPANALIYLNDEFVKTGEYQAKHTPGIYNCRVELPLYHTYVERFEITNTRKILNVKLKPAFGYIQIASQPESNAQVFVDGTLLKENTPVTTAAIASGEHTVQVIKDMYQPFVQRITVKDDETTFFNAVLKPNFAELNVITPAEASIVINNVQKGVGSWSGRLSAGVYSVEVSLQAHKPARQDIELKIGEQRTINLQPTPIYGSLDVMTSPSGANITINGKDYGTTPATINKLLIGDYTVQLKRKDFSDVEYKVTIEEGKTSEAIVQLQSSKQEHVATKPQPSVTHLPTTTTTTTTKPDVETKKKTPKKGSFLLNAGVFYPLMTDASIGSLINESIGYQFMLGYVKRLGVYAKFSTTFTSTEADYNADNFPDATDYLSPVNESTYFNRFGVGAGLLVNIKPLILYAGGGYGNYNHLTKYAQYRYFDNSFVNYIKYEDINLSGIELETGLMLYYKWIGFQLGVSTIAVCPALPQGTKI